MIHAQNQSLFLAFACGDGSVYVSADSDFAYALYAACHATSLGEHLAKPFPPSASLGQLLFAAFQALALHHFP